MIPIRDHTKINTVPIINYTLIGINVLVFLYMLFLPENILQSFISVYAFIPSQFFHGQHIESIITSMFLHGGFGHIIGNMLFLHIFGDNLEDTLGHIKFLGYYLLCGIGGTVLQTLVDPISTIPNLGASGAIAGLMGGYLLLFPKNKIEVLFPIGLFFTRINIPAQFMVGYWILGQFLMGAGSLGITSQGGVAYFAHIGGFITGIFLLWKYNKQRKKTDLELLGYY
jgi:membrane associated rhomboid family serine protease